MCASWASKRFNRVYKRCAHSAHHAHSVYRIRASSGLTARHVIYRCAASRPWRINVFSRRLPTYTCKAGLRNRTVRRATGEKSSMVCGALWHGVPSICLQNGLLHPYIAEKNRCAATRGRPFSLQRGGRAAKNHDFEISLSSARPDLRITLNARSTKSGLSLNYSGKRKLQTSIWAACKKSCGAVLLRSSSVFPLAQNCWSESLTQCVIQLSFGSHV